MVVDPTGAVSIIAVTTIKIAEQFFFLRINAQHREPSAHERLFERRDGGELRLALGSASQTTRFGITTFSQSEVRQESRDEIPADRNASLSHRPAELTGMLAQPSHLLVLRITGQRVIDNQPELLDEFRLPVEFFFRPPPGFRTRLSGRVSPAVSSRKPRRIVSASIPKAWLTARCPPWPRALASRAA